MARKKPTADVVRALFARSGNRCAFPTCDQLLVNAKNQFVGQTCHIEAALPAGQRYNPQQTEEQRRAYDNLILLCYAHHVETNDTSEYTVEVLKAMKQDHEKKHGGVSLEIDDSVIEGVAEDIQAYWDRIDRLNALEHVAPPDVAVPIDSKATFLQVLESCRDTLEWLISCHDALRESNERLPDNFCRLLESIGVDPKKLNSLPIHEDPLVNRNWETLNVTLPNLLQRLQIDLVHLELKFLEECLKTDPDSRELKSRLDQTRNLFAQMAQSAVDVD